MVGKALEFLWRLLDWLGRAKDSWEALPWLWRVFWFVLGPGAIIVFGYEISLPLAGKLFLFIVLVPLWFWGLNQLSAWRVRRDKIADLKIRPRNPANGLVPDLPIRDLFFILKPDLLDEDSAWQSTGDDIRDQFSIGRLKAWGRLLPSRDFPDDGFLAPKSTLQPIPRKHWEGDVEFTYRFFGEDGKYIPHTYPPHGGEIPPYADLQVNRAQSREIWPSIICGGQRPDTTAPFSEESSLDLTKWDQCKEFTIWDVAWLWVNEDPKPQGTPMSSRVEQAFRKLESAIESRDLEVRRDDRREVIYDAIDKQRYGVIRKANPNWVASREDLKSCANSLGDKPLFLFPRERTYRAQTHRKTPASTKA